MGIQNKMETDHIWIKKHPDHDKLVSNRTLGQHYMYYNVPNTKERVEMSYRSLGEQYDWELEKFRQGAKPADKGNRRRFFKNIVRIFKNPTGYFYWKTMKMRKGVNGFVIFLVAGIFGNIFYLNRISQSKLGMINYLELEGHHESGTGLLDTKDSENQMGIPATGMWRFFYSIPSSDNFVVNPVFKQNYRLYFDRLNYCA